jgi:sulfatase modifying factor 1
MQLFRGSRNVFGTGICWLALGIHLSACGGRTLGPGAKTKGESESGTSEPDAGAFDSNSGGQNESGTSEPDAGDFDSNSGGESESGTSEPDAGAFDSNSESNVDAASAPPSCAPGGPGMTNCGVGGQGTESCCTSLEVTGGTYYRTYNQVFGDASTFPTDEPPAADGGPVDEAQPATLSSFRLDKYLVTVGRFRQFMNAAPPLDGGSGWLPPPGSGKHTHLNGGQGLANSGKGGGYEPGWVAADSSQIAPASTECVGINAATWNASPGTSENLPINCVNWYEAYAFCIWDGGFLPSEAEWEYAAAGGSQQRQYPWGSTDPGTSSQYAIYGCYYPSSSGTCTGIASVAPVGTATQGAGLWGQVDLAGELFEWTLDFYDNYVDPCADCANLYSLTETSRVDRGGSFSNGASYLFPSTRNVDDSSGAKYYLGFRCARTP